MEGILKKSEKFEKILQILKGDEKKETVIYLILQVYYDCWIVQVDEKDVKKLSLCDFLFAVPGMKELYEDLDRKNLKNEEIRDSFVSLLMNYWLDNKKW